jgi:D-amino-acid dehydrogenase
LSKEQVQQLEPGIELDIYPNKLMPQLISYLRQAGVTFRTGSAVEHLVTAGNKIQKVVTGEDEFNADVVVLAGGSWLPKLTRMAGVKVPLMPGKGYSFTQEKPGRKLNIPAILCEARVAITPMDNRMRFGGTMEIAPVNDNINLNRVEGIVRSVPAYFKNINLEMPAKEDIWYGFRPCTPDGLPFIGASDKIPNMIIAGGHAMSGLSLGPATGRLVADIAIGKKPGIDLKPFSPDRFS